MDFVAILDDAMYKGQELIITTKGRGQIIGVPHMVDYFDTDDERFGYVITLREPVGIFTVDTVFIDEIAHIEIIKEDA